MYWSFWKKNLCWKNPGNRFSTFWILYSYKFENISMDYVVNVREKFKRMSHNTVMQKEGLGRVRININWWRIRWAEQTGRCIILNGEIPSEVVKSWALSVAHLQAHRECAHIQKPPSWHFILQLPSWSWAAESIPRGARAVAFSTSPRHSRSTIRQQRRLIYCRRATIICNGKLFSIWQQRHTHTHAGWFFPSISMQAG